MDDLGESGDCITLIDMITPHNETFYTALVARHYATVAALHNVVQYGWWATVIIPGFATVTIYLCMQYTAFHSMHIYNYYGYTI